MCFLEALFFLFSVKAVMRLSQFNRILGRNTSFSNMQVHTLKKQTNKQVMVMLVDYLSSAAAFLYLMLSTIFSFLF